MTNPNNLIERLEAASIYLSKDMLELLLECPADRSFVAADLSWSRPGPTGAALARLAERGLLTSASDPGCWGRSRYTLSPFAASLKASTVEGDGE